MAENTTEVITVTAIDSEAGAVLNFTISGGVDAALFSIDGNTGALKFNTAPNFEAPTDVGNNNIYNVQVSVSDQFSSSVSQSLAVNVTDVNESAIHVLGEQNIRAFSFANGTFSSEILSSLGIGASDVEFTGLGDVDGDGDQDVIVKTSGASQYTNGTGNINGQWRVAINNGQNQYNSGFAVWDGSVLLSSTIGAFSWTDHQVADFNGDGKADVLARMKDTGAWSLWTSTGTSFTKTEFGTWNTGVQWRDAMVGDFNNDGRMDLIGRQLSTDQSSGNVDKWYVGLGTATPTNRGVIGVSGNAWWHYTNANSSSVMANSVVGDFNGDGKDDLGMRFLLSTAADGSRLSQWWVSTTGTSGTYVAASSAWTNWAQSTAGGFQTRWRDVQVGDVNGDGKDDVIGRSFSGQWWLSLGGASLATPATLVWNGTAHQNSTVVLGDYTGSGGTPDGKLDLVVRDAANNQWLLGQFNGTTYNTPTAAGGTSSGLGTPNRKQTFTSGNPSGGYTNYQRSLSYLGTNIPLAPLEARAKNVTSQSSISGDSTFTLGRYLSDGSFDFEHMGGWAISGLSHAGAGGMFVADFTGDGLVDVLARDLDQDLPSGKWYLAKNLGNAFSTTAVSLPTSFSGSGIYDYRVSDFTGDGKADLLVMILDTAASVSPAQSHWELFASTGTDFASSVTVANLQTTNGVGWVMGGEIGDFDNDSKDDLAMTVNVQTTFGQHPIYETWVAYSNGSSTWQFERKWVRTNTASLTHLDSPLGMVRVGDYDADGRDDLLGFQNVTTLQGQTTGSFSVALSSTTRSGLSSSTWTTSVASAFPTTYEALFLEIGRFAGLDSRADVMIGMSGSTRVWKSTTTGFGSAPDISSLGMGYFANTPNGHLVADVDRDGYDDIVWYGTGAGDYKVSLTVRSTIFSHDAADTGYHGSNELPVQTTIRRLRRRRG